MKRAIACLLVCIIGLSGCESRQTEQTMSIRTNEEHIDVSQLSKKQEIPASNNPAPILDPIPTPILQILFQTLLLLFQLAIH